MAQDDVSAPHVVNSAPRPWRSLGHRSSISAVKYRLMSSSWDCERSQNDRQGHCHAGRSSLSSTFSIRPSTIFNYRRRGIRDTRHAHERLRISKARSLARGRPMTAAGEPTRVEPSSALYARLLGPAWLDLHPAIRSLHLTAGAATGRFEFLHGRGLAARLVRRVLRLPSSATALDVRLTIDRD